LTAERQYASDDYYKPPTEQQRKATTEGLEQLGDYVRRQPWYKETIKDHHYTEEYRLKRCTCWSPDQWLEEDAAPTSEATPS